ncbi:FadR/GntR family transcriptional regulator [Rhodoligotrophos defluvii]|uniref:FadR/GntR family transcriptional regulator n=1 Tax=Rhodoligotrophos defluvii TaxID=2561934 RepID=UPI00148500C4|nr:GntR family transcriptional regulator [Rhodoligotrophos defluvii]
MITPVLNRGDLMSQLRQLLQQGRLRPGDRLPNERDLAEASGLSRSTVREVLGELERAGLLSRHVGRGTYVTAMAAAREQAGNSLGEEAVSPGELMAFRAAVEPTLIELIVLHAADTQLAELQACVASGRGASSWQEAEQADRRFHELLYEATNNRLFRQLGRRVSSVRGEQAWMKLKERSYTPEKWAGYQSEHEEIAEALIHRDLVVARSRLRDHLTGVRSRTSIALGDV